MRNFEGVHLNVAILNTPPFVFWNKTVGCVTGYLPDMLELIAKFLNITYTLTPVSDGEYGQLINGTYWTGIIGAVSRGDADLGLSNLTPTSERSQVVRFLKREIAVGGFRMMFRKPDSFDNNRLLGAFVKPFAGSTWLSVALLLSAMAFLCCWTYDVCRQYETCQKSRSKEDPKFVENIDYFKNRNWIFIAIQTASQQGFSEIPSGASPRLVFISMWIFSLLIFASYSATLTSNLTYTKGKLPFTSLTEFLQQSEYKIAFKKGTSYVMMIRSAKKGEFFDVAQRLKRDPRSLIGDIMDGFDLASTEKYVFAHDQYTLQWLASLKSEMVVAGPTYLKTGSRLVVPHNSPYFDDLSLAITKLHEDGVISRLQEKWWPKKPVIASSLEKSQAVTNAELFVPFFLLICGIVLGFAAFLGEKYCKIVSYRLISPSKGNRIQTRWKKRSMVRRVIVPLVTKRSFYTRWTFYKKSVSSCSKKLGSAHD